MVSRQDLGIVVIDDLIFRVIFEVVIGAIGEHHGEEGGDAYARIEGIISAARELTDIAAGGFDDGPKALAMEAGLQTPPDAQPDSPVQDCESAGEKDEEDDRKIGVVLGIHLDGFTARVRSRFVKGWGSVWSLLFSTSKLFYVPRRLSDSFRSMMSSRS